MTVSSAPREDTFCAPVPVRSVLGPRQRSPLGVDQRRGGMDPVRDPDLHSAGAQLPGPAGHGRPRPARLQLHCGPDVADPGEQGLGLSAAGSAAVQPPLPAGLRRPPGHPLGAGLLLPAVSEPQHHGAHAQSLSPFLLLEQSEPAQPAGTRAGRGGPPGFRVLPLPEEAPLRGGDVVGEPVASALIRQSAVCSASGCLQRQQSSEVIGGGRGGSRELWASVEPSD